MKLTFNIKFNILGGTIDLEDYDAEEISSVDFTNAEQIREWIMEQIEYEGLGSMGIEPCEVDVAEITEIKVNDKPL